jgi:tRNA 2-thiocytidine biosynthesis protein TtcA
MLADWEREFPGRTESIFSSLRNVELDHLADTRKFDFAGLDARRVPQMTEREGASHATPGQSGEGLPGPTLSGLMSAQDEAELDLRLESLAVPA